MRRTLATVIAVALLTGSAGVVVGASAWRSQPAQAAPDAVAAAPDPCPNVAPFEATGTGANGYLFVPGIKGDSTLAKYPSWIVVNKLRTDVTGAGVTTCGAAAAPIALSKRMDRSSMPFVKAATLGTVLPTATFAFTKAGTQPFEYYRVTLTNVKVTSVSTQWKGDVPTELVKLSFTKICWSYTAQKADGSKEPTVQVCK
ncbi:Hcp family type VI secretion system effector [Tenggerimyces flavus]|uniref:Hcp family type VI secretion system effector n=1 Tax=Tenggerimyces flavus TaxID=1708749 RepID=A0ABV7Y4G9_9ACTN|nr:type VI secretion system tube protein Hcp [Tenggerimyces flavus]MBM7788512.1 type VI secretion system Hcp family effector [Tenggerimyces flavus]